MRADEAATVICEAVQALPSGAGRRLVAIAGPPAVGKTTLTTQLHDRLERAGIPTAVVPMDGFHYDNDHLRARGLLRRKGAPRTFDLAGFQRLLMKLHTDPYAAARVPLFDRDLDATLPEAGRVEPTDRCVLVEGNYLLLDADGWRDLTPLWSLSVFLDQDAGELERRLIARWEAQGLDPAAARRRAQENDLPNAQMVMSLRLPCDLLIGGAG